MANTYKWEDNPTVNAYLEHDGFDDCVYTVHWRLTGTSSETNPEGDKYTASVYGTVSLDLSDLSPASYVSKDDLTPTIVNDWVKETLGDEKVAAMKAGLKANIDLQITPTTETFRV
tara:strand:- start:288 stop:635 length:348 start_codon:yes stop_codon:yes gene_type:complete